MCISELPCPFHQFGFLVALASAWSLTWYQSAGSQVRVLVFANIAGAPSVHVQGILCLPLSSTCWPSLLPWFVTREEGCWCV
jgi:hypothetical protein